ncbi:hypothetical protein quinque_006378 [Culex quinquefasciatus]
MASEEQTCGKLFPSGGHVTTLTSKRNFTDRDASWRLRQGRHLVPPDRTDSQNLTPIRWNKSRASARVTRRALPGKQFCRDASWRLLHVPDRRSLTAKGTDLMAARSGAEAEKSGKVKNLPWRDSSGPMIKTD